MTTLRTIALPLLALGLVGAAPAARTPVRFAAPMQRWASGDGEVHLLRPIAAPPTRDDAPLGSLMAQGWRLIWDGSAMGPGEVVVRLALKVRPVGPGPGGSAAEVLQVGRSRSPAVVGGCLTYGLKGGSTQRLADRVINGRRYAVWRNGDAGMSQQIAATDLRTVVRGACYAVARFRYSESASDGDPKVTLSAAAGAGELDAALASLQLGRVAPGRVIRPPALRLPPGAVAR